MKEGILSAPREPFYYVDEPLYRQYTAEIFTPLGPAIITGTAFDSARALAKTVFEAVERYCLARPIPLQSAPASAIAQKFPLSEMPQIAPRTYSPSSIFPSAEVFELPFDESQKAILVPAQLITVPYQFADTESVLREPISTGAACAESLPAATLTALLECIERHSIILSYYSSTCRSRITIDPSSANQALSQILEELRRCRLKFCLLDISPPSLPVYCFLGLLLDESPYGPPFTAGAKAGLDPKLVALGALEECVHSRSWLRDLLMEANPAYIKELRTDPTLIRSFSDRALFWSHRTMLDHLAFYFQAPARRLSSYTKTETTSEQATLSIAIALREQKFRSFLCTFPQADWMTTIGVSVVKVLVPGLYPLFIDETLRVLPPVSSSGGQPTHFFL